MKYRLIKEYPGSPKLGTIIFKSDNYWCKSDKNRDSDNIVFSNNELKPCKYPEFWQEVVEKDYEILSLARFCSIKPKITDVSDYNDGFIEALLKCDNARIHSVKRISDGEVFTVGGIIGGYSGDKGFKIKYIWINNNNEIVLADYNKGDKGDRSAYLSLSKKLKQPLFTTEDGVDIYEGDIFL